MATPRKLQPAEWLDLIIEKAPELRSAGVTSLELDGVCIELAPKEQEQDYLATWRAPLEEAEEYAHPLNDPETYGLRDGQPLPGYSLVTDWRDDQ